MNLDTEPFGRHKESHRLCQLVGLDDGYCAMLVEVGDAVDRRDPLQKALVRSHAFDAAFDDDVHQQDFCPVSAHQPTLPAGLKTQSLARTTRPSFRYPLTRQCQGVDLAGVEAQTPSAPVLKRISSTYPKSSGQLPSKEVGKIQLQPRDRPPLHRRHRTPVNQVLRA